MSSIEERLAAIHKLIAQSGFAISTMLARRRMGPSALRNANAQLKSATAAFDKVLEQLNKDGAE